jgi:hypothetical protein
VGEKILAASQMLTLNELCAMHLRLQQMFCFKNSVKKFVRKADVVGVLGNFSEPRAPEIARNDLQSSPPTSPIASLSVHHDGYSYQASISLSLISSRTAISTTI